MKTLHLSIITIVGIVVIAMTTFGVFIEKLNNNPEHIHTGVTITGIKENYALNEPIIFSVMLEGYGTGCGDTKVILTKENDSQYKPQVWGVGRSCAAFTNPNNFKFNGLSANTTLTRAGNYTLTATFVDYFTNQYTMSEMKFNVIVPKITSIFDTGIHPFSIHVANTNFTLNYNISGHSKLLDANMDSQTKSLVLSMYASSNGTLSVSIPRALLDSKSAYSNQDTQFIVLVDGREIKYSETISMITRTLSIPFEFGTEKIEIIATQQI